MSELTMKEVLLHVARAGFKAKSHYDAVRMLDALMKPYGLTVSVSKVANRPLKKARLQRVWRNNLIIETVRVNTI